MSYVLLPKFSRSITVTSSTTSFFMLVVVLLTLLLPIHSVQAAGLGDLFNNTTSSEKEFLPVTEAFTVVPTLNDNELMVMIEVTPDYYVYKDKIKLKLPDGVSATPFTFNQTASFVDDPTFGKVAVFEQRQIIAKSTLSRSQQANVDNAIATLVWQGCAKAGLCYPPQRQNLALESVSVTAPVGAEPVSDNTSTANTNAANSASEDTSNNQRQSITTPKITHDDPTDAKVVTSKQAIATNTANNQTSKPEPSLASTQSASVEPAPLSTPASLSTSASVPTNQLTDNVNNRNVASSTQVQSNSQLESEQPTDSNSQDDATLSATDSNTGLNSSGANDQSNTDATLSATNSTANENVSNINADASLVHSIDVNNDPFGLATHTGLAFLLLFLAGLTLVFTPCVLPMLPIVSNIVAHEHKPSAMRGVLLTASYALGVSVAYGLLGMLVAIFGVSLGIIGWLQHPAVLLTFAAVFALFALYMADVLVWRTPRFISERLGRASKLGDNYLGSVPGSFVVGLLSALVVSPCVSFPLFGALFAVSTIGNPLLGFGALFMLGLGLSSPLIILGATQANFMPKAGEWMNWVKIGFALMLFAVSLLLLERVLMSPVMLLIWALWFLVVAKWMWSWQQRGTMVTQALAALLGAWAISLVIGAAMGNDDSLQPLQGLTGKFYPAGGQGSHIQANYATASSAQDATNHNTITVTTLAQLDNILTQQDRVLVDIVAEWCIECRVMEKALFDNPPANLANWQVVKLDITDTNNDSEAVLQRYQIPGPPTLLYYVDGKLKKMQVGEVARDDFELALNQLL